jgi:hypothetical protein
MDGWMDGWVMMRMTMVNNNSIVGIRIKGSALQKKTTCRGNESGEKSERK